MRILFFLLFIGSIQSIAQVDYYNFTLEEAANYAPFRNAIDMKNPDVEMLQACIFHVTNQERQKRKMPIFNFYQGLKESAEYHAEYMSESGLFSHNNRKEAQYREPSDRIHHFSPNRYKATGENISQAFLLDYDSGKDFTCKKVDGEPVFMFWNSKIEIVAHSYWSFAEEVVDAWVKSKGHRSNILYPGFNELGVAARVIPDLDWDDIPTVNCVQNFGGKK